MVRSPTRPPVTVAFLTLALSVGNTSYGEERFFNIPPEILAYSANEWAQQSGIQLLFDTSHWNVRTRGVSGVYEPYDALGALLRDTPFTYQIRSAGVAAIIRGARTCRPELDPHNAPLPPCVARSMGAP